MSRAERPARRNVDPGRRPTPPTGYAPALALVACDRCGAAVVDADPARAAHERFHAGLRALWQRTGGEAQAS